ncbi:MAG: T9SS type A sorting domain-containing protein, partial [Salibacteraceae bacterium]
HLGTNGFPTVDPNPYPIGEYSKCIPVGFCWYRYADLNMIWDDDAGSPWSFYKTSNNESNKDQEEVINNEFKIYPNPVLTGQLTIEGEGITKVEIFDMQGRLLISQNRTQNLSLEKLSKGLYQVILTTESDKFFETIFKL